MGPFVDPPCSPTEEPWVARGLWVGGVPAPHVAPTCPKPRGFLPQRAPQRPLWPKIRGHGTAISGNNVDIDIYADCNALIDNIHSRRLPVERRLLSYILSIRDDVQNGVVTLNWIPRRLNLADPLTRWNRVTPALQHLLTKARVLIS